MVARNNSRATTLKRSRKGQI